MKASTTYNIVAICLILLFLTACQSRRAITIDVEPIIVAIPSPPSPPPQWEPPTRPSFDAYWKRVSGQVVSINEQGQIDTLWAARITYSDDFLLRGENPFHLFGNQTYSNFEGKFTISIPNKNLPNAFLAVEIVGYEPALIRVDTLTTTNWLLINLQPKVYEIFATYNNGVVDWKIGNMKEYGYASVFKGHIRNSIISSGERKLVPEPRMGFENWLSGLISVGEITGSAVVEFSVRGHNVVEINYFSGKITDKGLDFIKNEEWEFADFVRQIGWLALTRMRVHLVEKE